MSTLSLTSRSTLARPARETKLIWWLAGACLGIGIGVAAATSQTTLGVGILLLPPLVALLARPEWLPTLLMATAFAEALSTGGVTLSRAVGPLAALIMILTLPNRRRVRLPRIGVLLSVIAYSGWAVASVLWTVNPNSSFQQGGTGYTIASLGLSLVMMLGIVTFVRRQVDLRRLMWTTWIFSALTGLVSVLQYASGSARAVGVSGDANFFAAVQVIALPIGAQLAMQVDNPRTRRWIFVGIGLGVGSIMTSLSRGGILALIAVFLLLGLQPARGFFQTRAQKRAFLLVVLAGVGVLLIFSFSALSARTSSLFSGQDQGSGRANLWQAAVTGWHEHEVRGLGFGAFIGQSDQLLLATPGVNLSNYALRPKGQYAHNAYLESLVELGIIGAVLFVTMLVAVAISLRRTAHSAARSELQAVSGFARALLLALAGFAFASVFLSTETNRMLWVLVGLAIALPRVEREELRVRKPSEARDRAKQAP
jgi:O-antigen ligase